MNNKKTKEVAYEMGKAYIVVGQHVNGITLNGYAWLLEEYSDEIKLFKSKNDAIDFLHEHGITDDQICYLKFCYLTDCPVCETEVFVNEEDTEIDGNTLIVKKSMCGHTFTAELN